MIDSESIDLMKKRQRMLNEVFSTESGKKLLDMLVKTYVECSVLEATPELTYYRLGQKELVQGLISDMTNAIETEENINE